MKQKLIDFLAWYYENAINYSFADTDDKIVEDYLKSINNESNEFRTVGNNENTQEKCDKCGKAAKLYKYCGTCMITHYEHKRK